MILFFLIIPFISLVKGLSMKKIERVWSTISIKSVKIMEYARTETSRGMKNLNNKNSRLVRIMCLNGCMLHFHAQLVRPITALNPKIYLFTSPTFLVLRICLIMYLGLK